MVILPTAGEIQAAEYKAVHLHTERGEGFQYLVHVNRILTEADQAR
jgi:hypothetical protein